MNRIARKKQVFGNDKLYRQIQEDALLLIESYGAAVSPRTAKKLFDLMPADEAAAISYVADTGRIYIPREVIERCLDLVRQGMDFWPKGFGTGGTAAYIVDRNGPRPPEPADMSRLAQLFGQIDILASLQSSFNICSRIKRDDGAGLAKVESSAIDGMVKAADGKLVMPTIRSDAGYDRLQHYHEQGHRVGAALSIISTQMTISDEMAEPFLKTVTRGLPFIMNSMPIGGLTGPYSMSSLAALAQAQAVFGMVLGQLMHPGIKCINSAMPTIADLTSKNMPMMFGSVSNTMLNILLAELNIFLGIPCCQSSCSHDRNVLDGPAVEKCREIFSLLEMYEFHMMRHLFGFSSQLNDFSIDDMEKQVALYREVMASPQAVDMPRPAEYDPQGIDAIFEGFERNDFRELDHTLKNIGRSFAV